jgi:adenosylcobinamide-GDP ribazoletransferase
MNWISTFLTAFRTLTVLPLPGRVQEQENFRLSLLFFPLVGLIMAGLLFALFLGCLCFNRLPALFCGLIVALVNTGITGALHLDGLADVCDGFGGGRTRERILEIFKDSRHGTFGVTAIVFVIAAKVIAYGSFIEHGSFVFIAMSLVASRTFQSMALGFMPYAGLTPGVASPFTGTIHRVAIMTISLFALALCAVCRLPWSAVSIAGAMIVGVLFLLLCHRKIGGITGDCIGALSEITELFILSAGLAVW